ncbi:gp53-like domain-containing protein [Achromobacter xylosoxidans]|uniref:gp53-like domain-containing protein n=1 Tax=Alcaligenes xylosoxydans xylosoxydans TaxID=85698 RepID=UPI001EEEE4C3|nr:hypothetical protein [Achromobacter xylosoxidans]
MQASNAPSKSPVPFAESGSKNTIPVASQIGVTPGLASFTDGFPPLTMTPLAAGGIPPRGQDFNGILYFLSAAARWGQAGAGYQFDGAFSTAIGGYPKGAQVKQAAGNGYWLNLIDNNTADPDSGGSGWVAMGAGIATTAQAQALTDDTVVITPKKLADALGGGNQSLTTNGYRKVPGGYIEQWGFATINPDTDTPTNFPIPFPNEVLGVYASNATTITQTTRAAKDGTSLSRFILFRATTSGSIYWRAIGR